MTPSVVKHKRGTTAQWAAATYILKAGELGIDTSLNKLKVGNGSSLWPTLPYINVLPSELTELAQDAVELAITAGTGITKTYNDTANTITLAVDSTIANKTYVDTAVSGLSSTSATTYIPLSLLGQVDGVAELDANGFVPDAQLPTGITRDTELSSAISTEVTNRNTAISTAISNLVDTAPDALNTLNELAAAINDDASYAATLTTALGLKAPIASPTFTGTVAGIDKTMVGLANVDNTTDALKPVSTATQTALDLKANLADPTFTGTVSGITKTMVGLGNVDNTSDVNKPVSTAVTTELNKKINNIVGINARTSSYTITSSDDGKLIEMSAGGTLTIPSDADYNFAIGTSIEVLQTGTSQVTITGNGFTPNATPGLKLRTQWSSASLLKRGSNSWVVLGDLAV